MIDIGDLIDAIHDALDRDLTISEVLLPALGEAHDEGKRMVLTMTGHKDINWPNPYRETERITVTIEAGERLNEETSE